MATATAIGVDASSLSVAGGWLERDASLDGATGAGVTDEA